MQQNSPYLPSLGILLTAALLWACMPESPRNKSNPTLKSTKSSKEEQTPEYNPKTAVLSDKAADLEKGALIFQEYCVACHGSKGEGGVGPNLTDEYWIHGGSIENVYEITLNGVPPKGMIAYKGILKPEEIRAVSSYILLQLQGSNPQGAKAPQGDK